MIFRILGLLLILWFSTNALAGDPGGNTVYTRIVDTGPGLCTITRMPGDKFFVYDTGHWNGEVQCDTAIKRIVPNGAEINLLILSHSDGDHVSATEKILATYKVNTVIRTGDLRFDTASWRDSYFAIRSKRKAGELTDRNLYYADEGKIVPGETLEFGDSKVVLISGFNDPPEDWGISFFDQSKMNNSISIVARLVFAGRSIFFAGDAVGRKDDGSEDCWATEKYMVDNSSSVPIKSDVLIAPHHGANNASSDCFIDEVDPEFVVFSAGHNHEHPRAAAVQRYLDHGVGIENMFRTDRGDNEGGREWAHGSTGTADKKGDDDIEIIIEVSGDITVRYAE